MCLDLKQTLPHKSGALSCDVSPCGRFLACGFHDNRIRIFQLCGGGTKESAASVGSGTGKGAENKGLLFHSEPVETIKHSESARTVSWFGTPVDVPLPPEGEQPQTPRPQAFLLASSSDKGHIKVWGLDVDKGTRIQAYPLMTHTPSGASRSVFAPSSPSSPPSSPPDCRLLFSVSGFVGYMTCAPIVWTGGKRASYKMKGVVASMQPVAGNRSPCIVPPPRELLSKLVCAFGNDGGLVLWNSEVDAHCPLDRGISIVCIAFLVSSSQVTLVGGYQNGDINTWDLSRLLPPPSTTSTTDHTATAVAESVVAGGDGLDTLQDAHRRRRRQTKNQTMLDQEKEFAAREERRLQKELIEDFQRNQAIAKEILEKEAEALASEQDTCNARSPFRVRRPRSSPPSSSKSRRKSPPSKRKKLRASLQSEESKKLAGLWSHLTEAGYQAQRVPSLSSDGRLSTTDMEETITF